MMTTSKIKIHPSFKRLRYANSCSKEGKEWISANPDIPWAFTETEEENNAGKVKVTRSKGNPKAKVSYEWLCCFSVGSVILLTAKVVYFIQGNTPTGNLQEAMLMCLLLGTFFFALLTFWFLYKDQFYAVFPEEVDDYVLQKREKYQAQKQAAIERLKKHHRNEPIEKIEVGAGDENVTR